MKIYVPAKYETKTDLTISTSLWNFSGEVHCYCNSPRCSSSNYMCESRVGCYSQLVASQGDSNDPYLHGCIESVTVERCEEVARPTNQTTSVPSQTDASSKTPELSCCFESMCNFKDRSKVIDVDGPKDDFGKFVAR